VTSERFGQPLVQNSGNAWFGVAPSVSFVARDWGTSFRLSGDRLSLVDALRLSESTRMVLTRVRLSNNSRITPFVQLGVGQWRTDTNILPLTPRATELAAQVGAGVELHITRGWQLACEAGGTMFIRDARSSENIAQTRLWSTMIASRIVF
jgi:opacity protein-like surface antigen